jgi:monofunctional biosynthetic peptidoglycan transglycosylase
VVGVLVASGVVALAIWEIFFLRISALADPRESRVLRVPVEHGARTLVVGPTNPYWTPLGAASKMLVLCVVKSEDDLFFRHSGFDWKELQSSFEENLEDGEYSRGGSTITMQLAKNLFLWRRKSVVRKALEMYLAWRLERSLTKRRILELYLNVVEWGPGVYGIGEASQHYFGKRPADLGLGESALLAGILPSPIKWSPDRSPRTALRRQQELLARLRRENALGSPETSVPAGPE